MDSDLSGGYRYPPFEQLGPDLELGEEEVVGSTPTCLQTTEEKVLPLWRHHCKRLD